MMNTTEGSAQPEQPAPSTDIEPKYAGYTRFEIELEFVQCLANPWYLNHLASQKYLSQPAFIAYLAYLQYWSRPPYLKYLTYPGPTLRHLEMLQSERFRQDIISPEVTGRLYEEGMRAAVEWHREEEGVGGGDAAVAAGTAAATAAVATTAS